LKEVIKLLLNKKYIVVLLMMVLMFSSLLAGCVKTEKPSVTAPSVGEPIVVPQELVIGIGRNFYEGA
jgi:predicted S18 family serine protease